jgi:hypothetical protein
MGVGMSDRPELGDQQCQHRQEGKPQLDAMHGSSQFDPWVTV